MTAKTTREIMDEFDDLYHSEPYSDEELKQISVKWLPLEETKQKLLLAFKKECSGHWGETNWEQIKRIVEEEIK
jgi:hypothetical protein